MRPLRLSVTFVLLTLTAAAASAQTPTVALTPTEVAVACAPPPMLAMPPRDVLRVVGSADAVARGLFGAPDHLVVKGGASTGMQIGQRYFVRRLVATRGRYSADMPRTVHTAGWVRVISLSLGDATAVVAVEHPCGDILAGDYLEPFEMPTIPADLERVDTTGDPDFSSPGRILYGDDDRVTAGVGDYVLINRGREQGVSAGAHFAIYRDIHVDGVPLTSIGEATVVSAGKTLALVRINEARDAVFSGDFIVPRK